MIRASSMKIAAHCPASVAAEGILISSFDPTSIEGTDVHRAIAMELRGEMHPPFYGATAAEDEDMVALAMAYLAKEGLLEKPYMTECRFSRQFAAATLDFAKIKESKARVVEFKTTYREDNHESQILAQVFTLLGEFPQIQTVDADILFLRGEGVLRKTYSRAWVEAWAAEFVHNTINHPEIYCPGEWCSRCLRKVACSALRELNQSTALSLAGPSAVPLSRDTVAALQPKVKLIREVLDQFDAFVRQEVIEHGPIPLDNGKELRALDITAERVNVVTGWDILREAFTDSDLSGVLSLRKTEALTIISDAAPKGQKTKAKEAFMDRLRAAGAVTEEKQVQVRELNVRN